MRRIVWKPDALADIDRLINFLHPKSPAAAQRAYLAIAEAAQRLAEFPSIGRPMDDLPIGYREILIPFSSSGYRLLYLDGDPVEVLAVRHMREGQY